MIEVDTLNTFVDENSNIVVSGEELGSFTMWINQSNE
jgi:hypothetical protein